MNDQVSKEFFEWNKVGIGKLHFYVLHRIFTIGTTKFKIFFHMLDIGN